MLPGVVLPEMFLCIIGPHVAIKRELLVFSSFGWVISFLRGQEHSYRFAKGSLGELFFREELGMQGEGLQNYCEDRQ